MSSSVRAKFLFGDFLLDPAARHLTRSGVQVPVSSKAFDMLVALVSRAGEVVTKDELLHSIWPNSFVEESNLSQHVFALRRALGDCAGYIVTVPGRGYQFREPVRVAPESPGAAPSLSEETPAPVPAAPVFRRFRRFWLPGAIVAVLLLSALGYVVWHARHRPIPESSRRVVIADFRNTTGNPTLDDTLGQALEIDLAQTPYLEIMGAPEAVTLLQQMGRDPKATMTAEIAREVCERGNRQVLVAGGIARVGQKYALTLEASACSDGSFLAGATEEAASEDGLLKALDKVAETLRIRLGESSRSVRRFDVPIEQATTPSLEALKAYSVASTMLARGADQTAPLALFQRAVELDPNFAMGYQAIANQYYEADEPKLAAESARKAFLLSDHVSQREKFAIQTRFHADTEGDLPASIASAKLWAATYPRDWVPWRLIAGEYNDMGQYPPAIEAGHRALALADNQAVIYSVLARSERRSNHWSEVKRLGVEAARHGAVGSSMHATLYMVAELENDRPAIEAEAAWGVEHGGWFHYATRAESAALHGQMKESRRLLRIAREKAAAGNLPETSDVLLLDEALLSYTLGWKNAARDLLPQIKRVGISDRADLVALSALIGDTAPAEAYLRENDPLSRNTLYVNVDAPVVRASLALARNHPADAITALQPAAPYELSTFRIIPLRAEAYLRNGQLAEAEADFRKVLANPGVDPTSLYLSLAHLGLARIYALQHNAARSKQEYEALFQLWSNADPDLPLLLQAKDEYKRLT